MRITTSVLEELLQALPQLRPQLYFKSSLTALSHAMEDRVLAGDEAPLVIANFQRERFYRMETRRYLRISQVTPQVYVLAAPETDFTNHSGVYETIAFAPEDALSQEWHLVVLGQTYGICLMCRERLAMEGETQGLRGMPIDLDSSRRFEGIWSFERQVSVRAAAFMLDRILVYRPELADKVEEARTAYGIDLFLSQNSAALDLHPDPFAERLVTYLQAGQYKLLKAYRSISSQERKERLVNSIASAIRTSLDPEEILEIATQELGQALQVCRCLIYRCKATDATATISHEYLGNDVSSLAGQTWPLQTNPVFQAVVERRERVAIENTSRPQSLEEDEQFQNPCFQELVRRWHIGAWLVVPVLYREQILGTIELHQCGFCPQSWDRDQLALVDAIATQVGVALIQAETYANLEDLNGQLEDLERTRSNLIAITGHELRTPLSTIRVCLESLASEPDMPLEVQQVMLSTALADTDRLRELVQDFLILSNLESGRVEWNLEPLMVQECVDLALSSVRARPSQGELPQILVRVPPELPLVQVDGEWLVQVLGKLLDNACKFTPPQKQVTIEARLSGERTIEVIVADTGRGIEPDRLEAIFDRFYQEEGALRRTAGGTGLGLAICRQIVQRWGGQIWAHSAGKDRGSQFHFTIPIADRETPKDSSKSPVKGSRGSCLERGKKRVRR
ncbi:MAG TPA: GAF domain-containing protein [Oscillatoriales cyanobacterium M59_W2019_021]|nr:MAG: GAF domain-containing protein [Cyanobacteria bacterium J055]HIK51346.1 GAF domain-containing protein [Oscillatoriales cyanobacterium M59_W2019_021]